MKKLSVGFYLSIVAAIFSIIGLFLYGGVMYRMTSVYVFLAAAVVVEVVLFILSNVKMKLPIFEVLPVVNSVLTAAAAVAAISLMVNQIGYVISGLDGMDTLYGLIYFEAAAIVAMFLNVVSAFLPMKKTSA